jgi:hypothetical protein
MVKLNKLLKNCFGPKAWFVRYDTDKNFIRAISIEHTAPAPCCRVTDTPIVGLRNIALLTELTQHLGQELLLLVQIGSMFVYAFN